MPSLWKIISNIVLALVFILLIIFSITEYSDKNTATGAQDKLPLVKITFSELSNLLAYFEKMPMINLLPAATKGLEYPVQTLDSAYQEQFDTELIKTNIKQKIPITVSGVKNNLNEVLDFQKLRASLKEQLSKDWSRP